MKAIRRSITFLVVAFAVINAARVPSSIFSKQNKIAVGRSPNGKGFPLLPSDWINVSIKSDPVISIPTGGSFEIECEAAGSPPPSVKWAHEQNFISETGFPEQNEVINTAIGKLKSRLVVDCVMPHHQGIYTCTGAAGSKTKTPSPVTVIVEANSGASLSCQRSMPKVPRVITWAPTIIEIISKDVTLPCSAIGYPEPEIYWINNKNQIIDSDIISPHYKVLENGDLLISEISWEDMGTYTCIAQNSVGQDKIETFVYPARKEE